MVNEDELRQLSPQALNALQVELSRQIARRRLETYKPYPKQKEFHNAGKDFRERLLMAPNRAGKTLCAAAETAIHLTGRYPDWWEGRKFEKPVTGMVASETAKLTRDGAQVLLMGWPILEKGMGMIPSDAIVDTVSAQGMTDAYDYVRVKHVSGGESILYFRSYDQGRERVQAMDLSIVWLDEEPDKEDFYFECLTRTNTTLGPLYMTFTPLKGMSSVVKRFVTEKPNGTHVTRMTLEDAHHFTPDMREAIISQYPVHERDARAFGVPQLGSGRVFYVDEKELIVKPFPIPSFWPRICGMDYGWDHPTAAAWLAWDRDTDIMYLYDCYRVRHATPIIHAAAINARGKWIPVAWPHDGLQHDKGSGEQLASQYRKLGVNMLRNKATFNDGTAGLEAGVMEMLQRMETGRFKVFSHLNDFFEEYRLYHREDGLIVKKDDDIISAARYAVMMRRYAKINEIKPQATSSFQPMDSTVGY